MPGYNGPSAPDFEWPDITAIRTKTQTQFHKHQKIRLQKARKEIASGIRDAAWCGLNEFEYAFISKNELLIILNELAINGYTALCVDLDLCISW
jgi:hypothetical protein